MGRFNYLFFAAAVACVLSCSVQESRELEVVTLPQSETFYACAENAEETKIYADDQLHLLWNSGDCIAIFNRSTTKEKYVFAGEEGANSGPFNKSGNNAASGEEASLEHVYAVYPEKTGNISIAKDGVISLTLPWMQDYVPGSFDPDAAVMVAVTDDQRLNFKNICGILSFKLCTGDVIPDGTKVSRLSLSGCESEALCGNAEISITPGSEPVINMTSVGMNEVLLYSNGYVALPNQNEGFVEFWFMLPPVTFEKGFKLQVVTNNEDYVFDTQKRVEVRRGAITRLAPIGGKAIRPDLSIEVESYFQYQGKDALEYPYVAANTLNMNGRASLQDEDGAQVEVQRTASAGPGRGFIDFPSLSSVICHYPKDYQFDNLEFDMYGGARWKPNVSTVEERSPGTAFLSYSIDRPSDISDGESLHVVLTYKRDKDAPADCDLSLFPLKHEFKAFCFNRGAENASTSTRTYSVFSGRKIDGYLNDELFDNASDVMGQNISYIPVVYNGGPVILDDYFGVHLYEADHTAPATVDYSRVKEYSINDLKEQFPTLELRFEIVPCTVGDSATPQDKFGTMREEGGHWLFTPSYVNGQDGTSVLISKDSESGISAVGHKPLVLAKLVDTKTGKPVLAGYFKIVLVEQEIDGQGVPPEDQFILRDFHAERRYALWGQDNVLSTDWIDMSDAHERIFGLSTESFRASYQCDGKTYIKNGSGTFIESDKYGTVIYKKDSSGSPAAEDLFEVQISEQQTIDYYAELGGAETVLYTRFYHGSNSCYVGLKVSLDKVSERDYRFVSHNPIYWYSDIDGLNFNAVRLNVPVPSLWGNTDVTQFHQSLNNFWASNIVKVVNDGSVYSSDKLLLEWSFAPQSLQPRIESYKWRVGSDSFTGEQVLYYNGNDPVVRLNTYSGDISYVYGYTPDYVSHRLLNMYDSKETDPGKMLYCVVRLTAYQRSNSGIARRELCHEDINVRFLRPLTFLPGTGISLNGNQPGGDALQLGHLFSARDWNRSQDAAGYSLFSYDSASNSFVPNVYNGVLGNIEWYGYYGISRIYVDTHEITASYSGSSQRFVDPNIMVLLLESSTRIERGNQWLDISTADKLGEYMLFYTNSMGGTGFNIYVPLAIEYAWGLVQLEVEIPIK